MHELAMPEWAKKVALERRGTVHPYENLDPNKTALIVVDLQNGFMVQDVAVAYVPMAVKIVPAVNKLAAAVRATGGKVFWIKNTFDVTNITAWSEYFDVLMRPRHPYTLGMLASTVHGQPRDKDIEAIPGSPPDMRRLSRGCSFAPRCRYAEQECIEAVPAPTEVTPGHPVACIKASNLPQPRIAVS